MRNIFLLSIHHTYLLHRKRWQDPEYRQTYVENAKGRNHSDYTKARIAESVKLKWQDAEYRTKIMTNQKNMMSNPGIMSCQCHSSHTSPTPLVLLLRPR